MKEKNEFYQYLNKVITNQDRENYQKISKKHSTYVLILSISALILIFTMLVIAVSSNNFILPFTVSFTLLVVLLFIIAIMSFKDSATKTRIKKDIGHKAINYLLEDVNHTYEANRYIDKSLFETSNLYNSSYDSYSGEDLIQVDIPNDDGTKSGVNLNLSDLTITETQTDNDGNSSTTTIFEGIFAYAQFPFNFKCKLGLNAKLTGTKSFSLESLDFNKKFATYSDNQLEAFCILTPDMMEKLITLRNQGTNLKISLFNNYLFIAISGKHLFEYRNSPTLTPELFSNFYDDVNLILKITKELQTNNKIFKM